MSKFLKERRTELGKELRGIAEITRIKGAYLKSIEEEEFDKLPVEVYTRGYIKEYAEFLGIPSDVALEPYEKYLQDKKAGKEKESYSEKSGGTLTKEVVESFDRLNGQEDMDEIDMLLSPEGASGSVLKKFSFKILWIFLAAAIGAGIYFLWPATKSAPPEPQVTGQTESPTMAYPPVILPAPDSNNTVMKTPQALMLPAPDSNTVVKAPHIPEGNKSQEKTPVSKDTKDKGLAVKEKHQPQDEKNTTPRKRHTLAIDATGKVWIMVVIDGTEKKEMLLNAGDKVIYGADKSFAVIVGNAAGANILFNGKSFKNLGAAGEVVRLNFPLSTVQQPLVNEKGSNDTTEQPAERLLQQPVPDMPGR
jgi:cytoskeleton protein RodZ